MAHKDTFKLPDTPQTLGVLAGAGEYPRLMVEGARRAGWRVICAGFRGAVDKNLAGLCDAFQIFRVGTLDGPRRFFVAEGVTHVVLTGQIKPACIYTMWPDATARKRLAQLDRRNAHTIFGSVCDYVHEYGMEVLPSTTFMEAAMPGPGQLAGPEPSARQEREVTLGFDYAREIARLDIGQSLIMQGERVACVEGYKGTNECIEAGGHRDAPVTLCKLTKPGHDMRFDVPCIGVGTIRHAIRANVGQIAFEAGRTILFQREEVIRLCNKHGIVLRAVALEHSEHADEHAPMDGDAAHAAWVAGELARLGIGQSAVVCEGVVITVEDADGTEKCLKRAAAYMKRLRFVRLTNWLVSLIMGRKSAPPAPMVMAGAPGWRPSEELRRRARHAGVLLAEG